MKNEIKHARSGNGRLVVGGLHADVLVVFRQTWFFIVVVVVVVGHDDFRTTTTRVRYFNAWLVLFKSVVLKFYDFYDDVRLVVVVVVVKTIQSFTQKEFTNSFVAACVVVFFDRFAVFGFGSQIFFFFFNNKTTKSARERERVFTRRVFVTTDTSTHQR